MDVELIFGIHTVATLLNTAPQRIRTIYYQNNRADSRFKSLLNCARSHAIAVQAVSLQTLNQRCRGVHQGIIAHCIGAKLLTEADLFPLLSRIEGPALLLVLDGVQDPHNLGACLRCADAFGVHAVVVPKNHSVGLTPTVRKIACGAAEIIPLIQATNLARLLVDLKQAGVWIFGLASEAQQSIYQTDFCFPSALILGGEARGLRLLTRQHCDQLICIPMFGTVASLNVSVASGIALFEAQRQRNHK